VGRPRAVLASCVAFCLLLPPLGFLVAIAGIVALVRRRVARGLVLICVGVLVPVVGALLYSALLLKPYRVPSAAMLPTIDVGDRIIAWRLAGDPRVGDLYAFHAPDGEVGGRCGVSHRDNQACPGPTAARSDRAFVKRVVAGPGDRIRIVNGRLIRNHRREREPHIIGCASGDGCDLPGPITVPPDHWFMMGDNRGASDDSRFWGPVPTEWLVGRIVARYSPWARAGGL
jgi:signal peptidase I